MPTDANDPRKDTRPENNTRPVVVNVSPDKAKVLLVDGEVRWEFHYLHTALVRDETMETTSVVFDQPRINAVPEEGPKKMGLPDLALPKDPEALMGYDCIILGDVSAGPARPGRARASWRSTSPSAAGRWSCSPASGRCRWSTCARASRWRSCCRSRSPKVVKSDAGFRVAADGRGAADRLPAAGAEPRPERRDVGQPAAALLGDHRPGQGRGGRRWHTSRRPNAPKDPTAAREVERNNALIVRQNFGFGKVVFVGIDSTWRWRFKKGDTYNHRFWSQVIRWAASDRALVAGNEFVRFGAREPVYRADRGSRDRRPAERQGEEARAGGPGRGPPDPQAEARRRRKSSG